MIGVPVETLCSRCAATRYHDVRRGRGIDRDVASFPDSLSVGGGGVILSAPRRGNGTTPIGWAALIGPSGLLLPCPFKPPRA